MYDAITSFEFYNVCRVSPLNYYSSLKVKCPPEIYLSGAVRFTVQKQGKYTISLDQKDSVFYKPEALRYCPVHLSLGIMEHGSMKIISFTSSKNLRNTILSKYIEAGEYFILFEKRTPNCNYSLEKKFPLMFEGWRDQVFSIYGPSECPMKLLSCE